ncbi:hypothetical protein BU16DRAFT_21372 [Lophium mytilinum]|uniref:Uncharacterized protein n=1 Tax=Lophium mytilinum TaxID=390894 RepID=A0A6A6RDP7_9PEZI|nr:hypothetical protein BU16DRAFT_21372 [Lophium mytilinum]
MTRKKQHGTRILDTTRSLTAAGGADVVECERHLDWDGTITGTFTQGIIHSAIQWLFRSWSSNDAITESCQSLELLLQRGADTEVRDGWGETPLLSATDYLCFSALPRVMRLLLKYGADTRAIDDDADGILHRISSPLTVCDVHGPGAAWYEEISEIIVSLLQMGCDPNSENAYGFTPSDRFMSPSSWTLWCECLEKAGLEVAQILQKDDKAYGVEWLENEIDEKYHTVVAEHEDVELPESKKLKEFATDGSSCQCCGSQRVWQSWQAPFDLYGSYLVDGSEGSLHSHIDYHSAGQPCTNWVKKHTCKHSEHNDNGFAPYPSARELSWRKHVAYRLWKNGLLGDAWGASDAWSMPTYL